MAAERGSQALRVARAAGWAVLLQCLLLGGMLLFQPTTSTPSMVVIASQPSWAGYVANRINTLDGHPVRAFVGTSEQDALADLAADRTQAVLVVDPSAAADRLTVSTAQGSDAVTTLRAVTASVQSAAGRTITVTDATEPVVGDPNGRHGYHLALTWLVSGLAFAVAAGRTDRRTGAQFRLLPLTVASGAAVAAVSVGIVCMVVPSWTGRAPGLFVLGTAAVSMAAVLSRAALAVAGTAGLAAGVALMALIAANPSAVGADGFGMADLLWRPIGGWTPPGLVVGGVRRIVYLDQPVAFGHWAGVAWWVVAALAFATFASGRRPRRAHGSVE